LSVVGGGEGGLSCVSPLETVYIQPTVAHPTISPLTCSVTTRGLQVTLPTIATGALNGMGSSAGDTPFDIDLDCPSGVDVHVTVTDTNSADTSKGYLEPGSGSTASGVVLRLHTRGASPQVVQYGPDSPVQGNTNQFPVGESPAGIPLSVQYYQNDSAVTAGSITGQITYTLSYQ